MQISLRLRRLALASLTTAAALACQAEKKDKSAKAGPKLGAEKDGVGSADGDGIGASSALKAAFVPFRGTPTMPTSLALTAPGRAMDELEALSVCKTCAKKRAAWLGKLNGAKGALPEVLVPSVREKIKNDPDLKSALALPGFLSDALLDNVASDEKITAEIRDGIATRLGGSGRNDFTFDGFLQLDGETDGEVRLEAQAVRWCFTFAEAAASTAGRPQSLEILRTVMEWSYLAGLELESGSGAPYGGMSRDLEQGGTALAGAYDPRKTKGAKRFFGGNLAVDLPQTSERHKLLAWALSGGERWRLTTPELPTLREEARIWTAAAAAFQKLRGDAQDAVLAKVAPAEAKSLPLVFLKTMSTMISGRFMDVKAHTYPGASATDLVTLIEAETAWTRALRNVANAGFDRDTMYDLEAARGGLTDALRVAVSQLIAEHIVPGDGAGLVIGDERTLTGRAFAALAEAERDVLPSPHLRSVVKGLVHGIAAEGIPESMGAVSALWLARGLEAVSGHLDSSAEPWAEALTKTLVDAVGRWDGAG